MNAVLDLAFIDALTFLRTYNALPLPSWAAQEAARLLHCVEDGERRSWLRGVFEIVAAARGEGDALTALKATMRGSDAVA